MNFYRHTIIKIEIHLSYKLSRLQSKWSFCPELLEYIASVENRPNRFFKFPWNFDFKNFQKVATITEITTLYLQTNTVSRGTIINNIIELDITLSLKSKIKQWGLCPECHEYIESVKNRPNRFFKFSCNFDFKKIKNWGQSLK